MINNKISLVVTTINKPNNNIKLFSKNSKIHKWNFVVVGDKKTPKNFSLRYGEYFDLKRQRKLNFKFSLKCPENSYARKNIGYLLAIKNLSEIIVETDDDNCPKKNFFSKLNLVHKVKEIKNNNWVNIYNLFVKKKKLIWPRGLPLDLLTNKKIIIKNIIKSNFYLQQGVCENNPDVDAIYRLIHNKINIKFKNNYKVSLGKSLSTFNSQNTIWFKPIFPLLYLPVTCPMRCTDIWRSLIALKILKNDNKKILFFGTTMFQNRNYHDLLNDFEQELPMYLNNKKMFEILDNLKLKKGKDNYIKNLLISYEVLIKNKFISKSELKYLNLWIEDYKMLMKK